MTKSGLFTVFRSAIVAALAFGAFQSQAATLRFFWGFGGAGLLGVEKAFDDR